MSSPAQIRKLQKIFPVLRVIVACAAAITPLIAQQAKTPDLPPHDLMRAVAANELAAARTPKARFLFHSRRTTPKGVENRIYIEANEGVASMIVGQGDGPLTPDQERAETNQLKQLVDHPDRLRRKQEHEKQELARMLRILQALPDAFCFEYATPQPEDNATGEAPIVRLNFRPNPSYSPPSAVEQVLEGMQGSILVDSKARRMVRINGTLFKEVSFGWGIFGHLDKGGSFHVQQADQGDGNWVITEMNLKLTGKILLLKSLNLNTEEVFTGFQRLPGDLPFAKAVDMLQTEQIRLAQNVHSLRPAGQ